MGNEFYELDCKEVKKNERLLGRVKKLGKGKHEKVEKLKTELQKSRIAIKNRFEYLKSNRDERCKNHLKQSNFKHRKKTGREIRLISGKLLGAYLTAQPYEGLERVHPFQKGNEHIGGFLLMKHLGCLV